MSSEVNCGDDDDDYDDEGEEQDRIFRPKLESFQYDHTGPYEPLLLSLPGEVPAVQVILGYSILSKHLCILVLSLSICPV